MRCTNGEVISASPLSWFVRQTLEGNIIGRYLFTALFPRLRQGVSLNLGEAGNGNEYFKLSGPKHPTFFGSLHKSYKVVYAFE